MSGTSSLTSSGNLNSNATSPNKALFVTPKSVKWMKDGIHWENVKPYEDTYFVLQRYSGSLNRAYEYRILLKERKKKVARGNDLNLLVQNAWTFLHEELPKKMPSSLNKQEAVDWITKYLEKLMEASLRHSSSSTWSEGSATSSKMLSAKGEFDLRSVSEEDEQPDDEKEDTSSGNQQDEAEGSSSSPLPLLSKATSSRMTLKDRALGKLQELTTRGELRRSNSDSALSDPASHGSTSSAQRRSESEKIFVTESEIAKRSAPISRRVISQAPPAPQSTTSHHSTPTIVEQNPANLTKSMFIVLAIVNLAVIFLRNCSNDTYFVILLLLNVVTIATVRKKRLDLVSAYQKAKDRV